MIASFEDAIAEIRSLLADSELSKENLDVLKRLIKIIENNIRIDIFCDVVSHSEDIDHIITTIDQMIVLYQRDIEKQEKKLSLFAIDSSSKLVEIYEKNIESLESLKENILKKDYIGLVKNFVLARQEEQDLIDLCAFSLMNEYNEFENFFGAPIIYTDNLEQMRVSEEIVYAIFKLISNKRIYGEITNYVDLKQEKEKQSKIVSSNNSKYRLYDFAVNHYDSLKAYINLVLEQKKYEQEKTKTENALEESYSLLEEYENKNFVMRINNYSDAIKLKNRIAVLETLQNELKPPMDEKAEATINFETNGGKAEIANLKKCIDNNLKIGEDGKSLYDGDEDTIEAEIISICINDDDPLAKLTSNLQYYRNMCMEANTRLEAILSKLQILEKNLSQDSLDLVKNYYEDCVKIVNLERSKDKNNLTPIISAFILYVLSASKELPWQSVKKIVKADFNVEELANKYNEIVKNSLIEDNDQFKSIKSRVEKEKFERQL